MNVAVSTTVFLLTSRTLQRLNVQWKIGIGVLLLVGVLSLTYFKFMAPEAMVIDYADVDDDDVEALGRMINSEARASDSRDIKVALAWTCRNSATRLGISVAERVMPGMVPSAQNTGGRFVSTRNPATDESRNIARDVMAGAVADPTMGSVQFDSPQGQRAALARNVSRYTQSPEEIAASRRADGKTEFHLPGVSPDYLRFWRYA